MDSTGVNALTTKKEPKPLESLEREHEVLECLKLEQEIEGAKAYAEAQKERARLDRLQADDLQRSMDWDSVELQELRIYDFTGDVDESPVQEAINTMTAWAGRSKDPITVRISSGGGSVIDGFAMYDFITALRADGITVNTVALGWAASMAGILLQAGESRYVGQYCSMLIHEVSSVDAGKVTEMEDNLAFVKTLQDRCLEILAARSTLTVAQIARRWKRKNWWLTATEILEFGFADGYWKPLTG